MSIQLELSVGRSFSGVLWNGCGSWFAVETIVESSTSSTTARSVFGKYAMRIGKATISRSMPQAMSLLNRALTEQSPISPIRRVICITIPAGSYARTSKEIALRSREHGGLDNTANQQSPVGLNNKRRYRYIKAARAYKRKMISAGKRKRKSYHK